MPVETPIMYDLADDAIRVHAEKFGETSVQNGYQEQRTNAQICMLFRGFQGSF